MTGMFPSPSKMYNTRHPLRIIKALVENRGKCSNPIADHAGASNLTAPHISQFPLLRIQGVKRANGTFRLRIRSTWPNAVVPLGALPTQLRRSDITSSKGSPILLSPWPIISRDSTICIFSVRCSYLVLLDTGCAVGPHTTKRNRTPQLTTRTYGSGQLKH